MHELLQNSYHSELSITLNFSIYLPYILKVKKKKKKKKEAQSINDLSITNVKINDILKSLAVIRLWLTNHNFRIPG